MEEDHGDEAAANLRQQAYAPPILHFCCIPASLKLLACRGGEEEMRSGWVVVGVGRGGSDDLRTSGLPGRRVEGEVRFILVQHGLPCLLPYYLLCYLCVIGCLLADLLGKRAFLLCPASLLCPCACFMLPGLCDTCWCFDCWLASE